MKIELPGYQKFENYYETHDRTETADYFGVSLATIDRWRVLLNIPRKTFKYRNLNQDFTDEQIDIINGSLLGDGGLTLVKYGKRNSKLVETHSLKQYGLLEWKANKLKPFSKNIKMGTTTARKIDKGKVVGDTTRILDNCKLETIVHPTLTKLENIWYLRENNEYVLFNKKRVKTVPDDLILNADIIAVWYFDDASNNSKRRQITFNTQAFSKDDCHKLLEKLKIFGVNCGIAKNRDQHVIQVRTSSYLDVVNLAKDKLPHECMYYKVDLSNYKPPDFSTRFIRQGQTQRDVKVVMEPPSKPR